MPEKDPNEARWTIGQFSRMTMLSARMLRHYDRIGLLSPGDVDPWNGYRYSSEAEFAPAMVLRRLREAREPHYRAVATLTVPSGPGPADGVVTDILTHLEQL